MKSSTIAFLCAATLAFCVLCGCTGQLDFGGDPATSPTAVATLQNDVNTLKETFRAEAEKAAAAGDTKGAETFTKAADKIEQGQSWVATKVKMDAAGNVDPLSTIVGLIPGVGPYAALAFAGFRWWRASNAGKSIVRHIDNLMVNSPEIASAMKNLPADKKATAHALLTPQAKDLIDSVSVT